MQYNQPYGVADTNASYINGDPSVGRQGSIPPAAAFEYPQREIVALITAALFTPDNADLQQLLRAVRRQYINFAVDTGAADALSVTLDPALEAYQQGFPLRVLAAADNTGATTINVNGLGTRAIKRPDGSDLQATDIVAGMIANLIDTGTVFQLQNPLHQTSTSSNYYNVDIPYVADSSVTPNTITAVFSPAITSISEGDLLLVKLANTVTGAATITVNALPTLPLSRNDGQALQNNDIVTGEVVLIEYHGTYYQLLFMVPSQTPRPGANGSQSWSTHGTYSFTVPVNTFAIFARVWAAGGGGGGCHNGTSYASSGAGGGEYREGWINVTPGQIITVTVGQGGAGGSYATNGVDGGDSSLAGTGVSIIAKGGLHSNVGATGIDGGYGLGGTGGVGGSFSVEGAPGGFPVMVGSGYYINGFGGGSWGAGNALFGFGTNGILPGCGGSGNSGYAVSYPGGGGGHGADGRIVLAW